MNELIVTLILGGYAFTAGSYVFSWKIYTSLRDKLENHMKSRVKQLELEVKHLRNLCDDDCNLCFRDE